jgi:hypothetical protein
VVRRRFDRLFMMGFAKRWPIVAVIALWAAVYLPHLLACQTLPARDVGTTQIPWRTVWRAQVLAGSPPLWDPYSNGGRPLLANPNTMAAYPGTALFLLLSPEVAAAWHIALHHLLFILGCYVLARRSGAALPAAALAAGAVGTCGIAWSAVTFLNFQASLAWGIWALATAVPPPRPGRPALGRAIGAGALLGLSFLGGEPVTAAFAALAWTIVALMTWRPRPAMSVLTMCAAAGALAAPVLVPLLAIYPETVRGGMLPATGAMSADALAPRRFVELLFPNILGAPLGDARTGFWAAASFPWQRYYPVIFVGVLPLLCLPFARRVGRRLTTWWAIAAAGTVSAAVLSVPSIAARAQDVPFFGSTRYAIKFLTLTVLAFPPLVAAGWESLATRWWTGGRRAVRAAVLVALLLAPAVLWPGRLLRPVLAMLYPRSASTIGEVPADALRRAALSDWAAFLLPPATLVVAGPVPLAGAAAVVVADILGGSGTLLFENDARWAQPPPARAALGDRPVVAVVDRPLVETHPGNRPAIDRYWAPHVALLPESGTRWGVAYVLTRGPDGLEPIRQELLAGACAHMSVDERARVARAIGATAIIARGPVNGWSAVWAGDVWVGRTLRPSPRAYLATRLLPAEAVLAAATTMAAASFRPGEDAVVPGAGAASSAAGGTVVEGRGSLQRRVFDITTEGAGLLVVQQSFMRCWRATVDGKRVLVEPANGANTGIRVPAGHHRVVLFLDPLPYRIGLLGPLLLVALVAFSRRVGASRGQAGASDGAGHSTPATPPAR